MLDAFALAILGAHGPPGYPGVPGHEPDEALARRQAAAIDRAAAALRAVAPEGGAYVSESNYFQPDWEQAFWGENAKRLRAVKAALDPDGVFVTHHGPGTKPA
jgi:FAD/FMN-containing dehydrogenase